MHLVCIATRATISFYQVVRPCCCEKTAWLVKKLFFLHLFQQLQFKEDGSSSLDSSILVSWSLYVLSWWLYVHVCVRVHWKWLPRRFDFPLQSESWLCQEKERLDRESQLLREQKQTFKSERKNFTEAVINFGEKVLAITDKRNSLESVFKKPVSTWGWCGYEQRERLPNVRICWKPQTMHVGQRFES